MTRYGSKLMNMIDRIQHFDNQCAADEHTDTDEMWQIMYEVRDVLGDLAKYMIDCATNPMFIIDTKTSPMVGQDKANNEREIN